jgi:prepilin-type N-terminal cleavage/methylation domain-containing protein
MIKKGFSLLELLVVIGIISILLAIAAASYSTTQMKSRDARRLGDLKSIQQAAEQYYSICGFSYPNFAEGASSAIICIDPSRAILPTNKLPLDPKTDTAYECVGTCDTTQFTLCATPELGGEICVSNQQ